MDFRELEFEKRLRILHLRICGPQRVLEYGMRAFSLVELLNNRIWPDTCLLVQVLIMRRRSDKTLCSTDSHYAHIPHLRFPWCSFTIAGVNQYGVGPLSSPSITVLTPASPTPTPQPLVNVALNKPSYRSAAAPVQ
jgi:hypothetical protein